MKKKKNKDNDNDNENENEKEKEKEKPFQVFLISTYYPHSFQHKHSLM